jgi:rare lipoprotein A
MRWPGTAVCALALAVTLAGCATAGASDSAPSATLAPVNGPQADYPVLVGDPYRIGEVSYRPEDTLNYDEVGYLAVDSGAMGVTGAHHTLPVPSYAEVTSLTSGRTILVRLERRGPMDSNHLVALSPAALAQLDATPETAVRVRRVNPPEEQRAMLRGGGSAPLRMDTPMALVEVLRRKLAAPVAPPAPVAATPAAAAPAEVAQAIPEPLAPPAGAEAPPPPQAAPPQIQPATLAITDGFVVQAAAFSSEERATNAAAALGGQVTPSGRFFRVRTGPFATRAEAEASLANVRAAGYSDARILTGG